MTFPERLTPTSAAPPTAPAPPASEPPTRPRRAPRRPERARRPRPWRTIAVAAIGVLLLVAAAVVLSLQTWSGSHMTPLARALLRVSLVGGILPVVVEGLAIAVLALVTVAMLTARRPSRFRVGAAAAGAGAGALLGGVLVASLSASNAFGVALDRVTAGWAVAAFAAIGMTLTTFWRSAAWRKLLAVTAIAVTLAAGFIGINADFGLNRTIADVAGISTNATITLPSATATPTPTPTLLAGGALWANWHPPEGMPTVGHQGQVVIPATVSGFVARPAGLYLPPAALVENPPELPLVIMMMGQPGNPDPSFSAAVLDRFAAQHGGLAPIVLVADQIGNPAADPLCLDTPRQGKVETYLMQDVVGWARTHLHVLQDRTHWTIAGYSNGGECALSLGVKYPQVWGNVLDISGEEYPGSDHAAGTLAADFGGNRAAYEATWPLNELAGKSYPDTVAIFTVGSNDGGYRTQARVVNARTAAAGWKTTYFEVVNGGHVLGALNGGLQEGYTVLYPRLGLSQP